MKQVKTFKDLKFHPHPYDPNGKSAKLFFDNGYGVSVVRFQVSLTRFGLVRYGSYTRKEDEWEVAILRGTKNDWDIAYDTPITDDVIGYCKAEEVTKIMRQIQELPKEGK